MRRDLLVIGDRLVQIIVEKAAMTIDPQSGPGIREIWHETTRALDAGDFTMLDEFLKSVGVSIVDLLAENDAPREYMEEALTWAAFTGRTGEVKELIDKGVDPTAGFKTGMAAFHWAANRGNLETVKLLIDRGVSLEQKNMYDGTVLNCTLWSVVNEFREAHSEIIEVLVAAGAKVESGTLEWLAKQNIPPNSKARIDAALRGGATT